MNLSLPQIKHKEIPLSACLDGQENHDMEVGSLESQHTGNEGTTTTHLKNWRTPTVLTMSECLIS